MTRSQANKKTPHGEIWDNLTNNNKCNGSKYINCLKNWRFNLIYFLIEVYVDIYLKFLRDEGGAGLTLYIIAKNFTVFEYTFSQSSTTCTQWPNYFHFFKKWRLPLFSLPPLLLSSSVLSLYSPLSHHLSFTLCCHFEFEFVGPEKRAGKVHGRQSGAEEDGNGFGLLWAILSLLSN